MTATGTWPLLRFAARRERIRLLWWLAGVAALVGFQSAGSQSIYGSAEKLAQLRDTIGGNAAIIAMSGPKELLHSVGGEAVFEIFSYVSIVVALMNMFLIVRHTRSDEESGRAELLRSARVGRHAPLAAALAIAGIVNVLAAVVAFAAAAGTELPIGGSALLGAAVGAVGLVFAAVTAVAVQVFENHRAAYGAVCAVLGASYVLRAIGDSGNGLASWFSPIGWGQRTFPFAGDRWWPLLLPLGLVVVLLPIAVALLDRRDFGAGLLSSRPGPPVASATLGSPLGLAWRLQRASLLGWTAGLFLLGVAYGSIGDAIDQFIGDNPEVAEFFPGGAQSIADSYLAFTLLFNVLIATAYGVSSALRARGEETSGRAEAVLATPTSRVRWLTAQLVVAVGGTAVAAIAAGFGEGLSYGLATADGGQVLRLTVTTLVYLPAAWTVVAFAVLGFGWLPRAAAGIGWALFGLCMAVGLLSDVFNLPEWLKRISPFAHTPLAPLEPVTVVPLATITIVALALAAGGFVGLRRRDVG